MTRRFCDRCNKLIGPDQSHETMKSSWSGSPFDFCGLCGRSMRLFLAWRSFDIYSLYEREISQLPPYHHGTPTP